MSHGLNLSRGFNSLNSASGSKIIIVNWRLCNLIKLKLISRWYRDKWIVDVILILFEEWHVWFTTVKALLDQKWSEKIVRRVNIFLTRKPSMYSVLNWSKKGLKSTVRNREQPSLNWRSIENYINSPFNSAKITFNIINILILTK